MSMLIIDFDSISIKWPEYSKDGSMGGSSELGSHLLTLNTSELEWYRHYIISKYEAILPVKMKVNLASLVNGRINWGELLVIVKNNEYEYYTSFKENYFLIYKFFLMLYAIIYNEKKYKSFKIINSEMIPSSIKEKIRKEFKKITFEFVDNIFNDLN